ncbi:essential MCU regulator, mitochondrial [Drosophila takahashii]|uniref:essential MCU regulator, mitochondrial n=1 Tax=Drosophila takahashii TaxID=29030 RepID=UPI001CF8B3E4|nr:essential MCU regulator, mitochondrial [Drosophila takahashii]
MPLDDDFSDFKELRKMPKRSTKYTNIAIMVSVIPGILLGGYMGKKLAQFLEVFDLYAPDIVEDDD